MLNTLQSCDVALGFTHSVSNPGLPPAGVVLLSSFKDGKIKVQQEIMQQTSRSTNMRLPFCTKHRISHIRGRRNTIQKKKLLKDLSQDKLFSKEFFLRQNNRLGLCGFFGAHRLKSS